MLGNGESFRTASILSKVAINCRSADIYIHIFLNIYTLTLSFVLLDCQLLTHGQRSDPLPGGEVKSPKVVECGVGRSAAPENVKGTIEIRRAMRIPFCCRMGENDLLMLVHDSSPMALMSHEQYEQSAIRAILMADNRTKANLHTAVKRINYYSPCLTFRVTSRNT